MGMLLSAMLSRKPMFIVVKDCFCRAISENRQTIDAPQNVFDFVACQFGFCTLGLVGHGSVQLIDNYRMSLRTGSMPCYGLCWAG